MKRFGHYCQRGISLLEVMLSLSIIAVVLIMAVRYYSAASRSSSVNKVAEQLSSLSSAILQYRQDHGSVADLSFTNLDSEGYFPRSADFNGTTMSTPYGAVTLTLNTSANTVTINITSLTNTNVCTRLYATFNHPDETACPFTLTVPNQD